MGHHKMRVSFRNSGLLARVGQSAVAAQSAANSERTHHQCQVTSATCGMSVENSARTKLLTYSNWRSADTLTAKSQLSRNPGMGHTMARRRGLSATEEVPQLLQIWTALTPCV